MIYTVTFNPALDYVLTVEGFNIGVTNRAVKEQLIVGGKGINVSSVLANLGVKSTALGFTAGFTGDEIARRVEEMGVLSDFVRVDSGMSRINVKLKSGEETEINALGPAISQADVDKLFDKLRAMKNGDVLVLAGSIPSSVSDEIYMEIMELLSEKEVSIIVDATNSLLMNVLKHKPFLIKPNSLELGEIFGVEIGSDKEKATKYAKILREKGARNVLVSMAGDGAVLVCENGEVLYADAPKGEVVNSVGAGDSMVAGFLFGWESTHDYAEALKMGIASGSASTFSSFLATKSQVNELVNRVKLFR